MRKHTIPLDALPKLGFVRTDEPLIVYHMTDKENLNSILNDGKIRTFEDFVCFFMPTLEDVEKYIYLSRADEGRISRGFDGRLHQEPPLDHANTVVLELIPRYKEPMSWFKEKTDSNCQSEKEKEIRRNFDDCRIAHYGDMKFDTRKVIIHKLTDIDILYPYKGKLILEQD